MTSGVKYFEKHGCYYKVNDNLKRITKIQNNEVSYPDYDTFVDEIKSHKKIQMNQWKHIENSFFISRDFEWEYNGIKYRTTNKPVEWNTGKYGGRSTFVFHNGKIWLATYSGNYYPRIYLEREKFINPKRNVLFEKENLINTTDTIPKTYKWTDIKYCRHFEEIK